RAATVFAVAVKVSRTAGRAGPVCAFCGAGGGLGRETTAERMRSIKDMSNLGCGELGGDLRSVDTPWGQGGSSALTPNRVTEGAITWASALLHAPAVGRLAGEGVA